VEAGDPPLAVPGDRGEGGVVARGGGGRGGSAAHGLGVSPALAPSAATPASAAAGAGVDGLGVPRAARGGLGGASGTNSPAALGGLILSALSGPVGGARSRSAGAGGGAWEGSTG